MPDQRPVLVALRRRALERLHDEDETEPVLAGDAEAGPGHGAAQPGASDLDPGLLAQFAAQAGVHVLVGFELAAQPVPLARVNVALRGRGARAARARRRPRSRGCRRSGCTSDQDGADRQAGVRPDRPARTVAVRRVTTSAPSTAIIAPLSVHRAGRGRRSVMPRSGRPLLEQGPEPGVGRHSPAQQEMVGAQVLAGVHGLGGQHVAHRLLEGRGHVGHRHVLAVAAPDLHPAGRRPSSAPRTSSRNGAWPGPCRAVSPRGKAIALGSPSAATRSMTGSPGVRQPEQPGHLVVGLAGGVVDGGAELDDVAR